MTFCCIDHRRLWALLLLLVPLFSPGEAAAQLDRRLSVDVTVADIPDRYRIQDVDSIGALKLIVWGTSALDADGALHGELWYVLASGITSAPARLTVAAADPSGAVRVIPVANRFIVIWNDRRSDLPGNYFIIIDTAGAAVGQAQFINAPPFPPRDLYIHSSRSGALFVWNDTAGTAIMIQRLDSNGSLIGSVEKLADGALRGVYRIAHLPLRAIVDRDSAPPLVVDVSGGIEQNAPLLDGFDATWAIAPDGRMAHVVGERIEEYASPLELVPERALDVPFTEGAIPATLTCGYRADGRLAASYARARSVAFGARRERISVLLTICADLDGQFVGIDGANAGDIAEPRRDCEIDICSADTVGIVARPNGGRMVTVRFGVVTDFDCNDTAGRTLALRTLTYPVTSDGDIATASGAADTVVAGVLRRVEMPLMSAVEFGGTGDRVLLKAPAAAKLAPVPERMPGISLSGDRLLVGWLRDDEDTSIVLRDWNPVGPEAHWLDTVNLLSRGARRQLDDLSGIRVAMLPADPSFVVAVSRPWTTRDTNGTVTTRDRFSLFYPGEDGWRERHMADRKDGVRPFRDLSARANRGGTIATTWGIDTNGLVDDYAIFDATVTATTFDGRDLWSIDHIPDMFRTGSAVIPIGEREVLAIWSGVLARIAGGGAPAYIDSGIYIPYGQYYLLSGEVLLLVDLESPWPGFHLYDLHGNQLAQLPVDGFFRDLGTRDYSVVTNPNDSLITILLGRPDGLMRKTMNRSFKSVRPAEFISDTGHPVMHPAGVYRNDTLFVVWEDYRDSTPAIYARAIAPDGSTVGVREIATEGHTLDFDITPNPARDGSMLRFTRRDAGTDIDVADVVGRPRLTAHMPAGESEIFIATGELPSGVYMVRAVCNGRAVTHQFRIVR